MKYASLVKLGGELIEAADADYADYKGFLLCPNCGEPVFLRKAHKRGDLLVADSFVHHRAIPEVSACELRVGGYSSEEVEASRAIARGQRLSKLKISLWKYLKATLALNLKSWSRLMADRKSWQLYREVVDYGAIVCRENRDFILDKTFPRISVFLAENDSQKIQIDPTMKDRVQGFLNLRSRDWVLHAQISKEALELFLDSPSMAEIRDRLLCCLCHPQTMGAMPELLDLDTATEEWRIKFVSYLTLEVCFVFLMVDWLGIWNQQNN